MRPVEKGGRPARPGRDSRGEGLRCNYTPRAGRVALWSVGRARVSDRRTNVRRVSRGALIPRIMCRDVVFRWVMCEKSFCRCARRDGPRRHAARWRRRRHDSPPFVRPRVCRWHSPCTLPRSFLAMHLLSNATCPSLRPSMSNAFRSTLRSPRTRLTRGNNRLSVTSWDFAVGTRSFRDASRRTLSSLAYIRREIAIELYIDPRYINVPHCCKMNFGK